MEYVALIIIGTLAGILGGLLGIGGSVIMIPAMVWILGPTNAAGEGQMLQYQGAAMIVNFMLAGPSALKHLRARAIYKSLWKLLVPGAIVGTIAGVALAKTPLFEGDNDVYLRHIFGAFLVYTVFHNFYKLMRPPHIEGLDEKAVAAEPTWKKLTVGSVMGLFAGLLGLGGGAQAVPMQQVLLKVPLRNAIATSSATIFAVSWIGAIAKNVSLGDAGNPIDSLKLAACLAPTAMIGGYIGGHLTHTLPMRAVRVVFIVIMGIAAWKMLTA